MKWKKSLIVCGFALTAGVMAGAQTAPATPSKTQSKVSAKEPIAPASNSTDAEMDHMAVLLTDLKAQVLLIQDPATKRVAETECELVQHMYHRLLLLNKEANNMGKGHHHIKAPMDPALKQAPKPPA